MPPAAMSSARRADGSLKDASEIAWYNDAEDDSPMVPPPAPAHNGTLNSFGVRKYRAMNWTEPDFGSTKPDSRALRLMVRLGQPFDAFLLAQQRVGEYKRIASDHNIIAQVKDIASVDSMDVGTVEIL
ncbi:uncharacterized protein HD556DRAFT_1444088 [Suillus plorans]|uniref:Uncharacterized protein n=1 Tax=Suillus plorans TaxID=116603 RepID=A0A9P7DHJ9_9AGAM|nr:uncharacterized protein HD556DRAFT_1444088 [Suillus plorans]KAG1792994.1 hypothetical protein HD556DRAFT_1444088 [Suillus plorans]